MSEEALADIIKGCRANQQSSQYQLYGHFYNYAMTVARRYVSNTEAMEEVVNDAFYKVFTKLDLYGGELSFKFWLRRILINTALDYIRAQKRLPQFVEFEQQHDTKIEADVIFQMTRGQILAAVAQLPLAYRTVFNLYVVDEYSHDEIAEALNISVGTSKSNLSRARQLLKRIVEKEEKTSSL
jgi:RNA polymerase sigma factor (sigma-70 family)